MSNTNPVIALSPPALRKLGRTAAATLLIWIALCSLAALNSLNDDLRHGLQGSYWLIWQVWAAHSAMLVALGVVIYAALSRWPQSVSNAKGVGIGYALVLLAVLPLQLGFLLKLALQEDGPGFTWASIEQKIEAIDSFTSVLRLTSVSAVYFAVVAIKIWQQSQQRARAWAKAKADSLALHLALEQQRGLALRAQLEPHFVFNALNAISALVRADNKELALTGLRGLSDLLRYALAAGETEWVKLSQELEFIEDYLALQRLRYGARLQIAIEGANQDVQNCECPPLLLQPLVENALRHDLDCHEQSSDIHLTFKRIGQELAICVSNPLHSEAATNPGTGLGLRNTEERLTLAYGGKATVRTGVTRDRFQVHIRIPLQEPD
ncbi:MAG TPA: histidine kinase [Burkholderiaceae bacterium]|jgi:sensor histidine kinase YesM